MSCARLRPDLIHDDFRSDNPRVSFDFGDSFLRMVNLSEIHLLILSMQAIVVVLVDGKVSVHRLAKVTVQPSPQLVCVTPTMPRGHL